MKRPVFVAELTINHLGMIKIAKSMIKAAKNAGADFVKFKIKKVSEYYTESMPDWRGFPFKTYRQSLELSVDDFVELDKYCAEVGIGWFSTIHDEQSFEFVRKFDPPMYKVASMDVGKTGLLKCVVDGCEKEKKPLVVSVGGRTFEEIKKLVNLIKSANIDAYILHTVSIYPTPEGRSNISFLRKIIETFGNNQEKIKFGYSGHEEGYGPTLLAGVYGAAMIERHFTLSREYQIHHIESAITPEEFSSMTRLINSMLIEQNANAKDVDEAERHFLRDMKYTRVGE